MTFDARALQKLAPWLTADLERYLAACAKPYEAVEALAAEHGVKGHEHYVPPYGVLFNPETCPDDALAYLGQYVGVVVQRGATEAEARAAVKAESGQARGTRSSMEALLVKALGAVPFYILERTKSVEGDNAYWVTIIIPTGHVTEAIYPEINSTIPAGIWYTILERSDTWFVVAAGKKWSAVKAGLKWSEAHEGEP